jgi:hypothetical protein
MEIKGEEWERKLAENMPQVVGTQAIIMASQNPFTPIPRL